MAKRTVLDLDVKGKKVIVRVDFNVPIKNGVITDDNRITAALPTINHLVEKGARVVLMSHLGKVDHKDPEKTATDKAKNNMAPVAERLAQLVKAKVTFVPVTKGSELEEAVKAMHDGEIVLVQNTRYEKGESKNDPELAAYWASLGDLFVSDAFGSVHRAHASTVGIAERLPSALGFLVEKEVKMLSAAIDDPKRPLVAILGGAKVSDKIAVIENLLKIADKVIIGGGMAYTFFKAQGYEIGTSLCEDDRVELAKDILARGEGKLFLPKDNVVANAFDNATEVKIVDSTAIPVGFMGLDIGPKTVEYFTKLLQGAKTVIWNGPVGVFEKDEFAVGTEAVCKAIAELDDAMTVIGGGDSASAAKKLGYSDKFSHISTGGGASLEFMEGKELPGIAVIQDKE
ncbi:MAG: phosphoglycerate kinase [Erysipelotrichaceae bacterium]|nr:phosphoglycerate kinase [Erysipelotrichaceae bacterium]MDD3924893.1 phosphoglycerate kinase [Erysipelotrichaceae bacterium]